MAAPLPMALRRVEQCAQRRRFHTLHLDVQRKHARHDLEARGSRPVGDDHAHCPLSLHETAQTVGQEAQEGIQVRRLHAERGRDDQQTAAARRRRPRCGPSAILPRIQEAAMRRSRGRPAQHRAQAARAHEIEGDARRRPVAASEARDSAVAGGERQGAANAPQPARIAERRGGVLPHSVEGCASARLVPLLRTRRRLAKAE